MNPNSMKENQEPRVFVFIGKQDVYTIEQIAVKLGVAERTVAESLREGSLKGYKRWRKWYVLHEDLMEFITGAKED